jgi:hypothetical protein
MTMVKRKRSRKVVSRGNLPALETNSTAVMLRLDKRRKGAYRQLARLTA